MPGVVDVRGLSPGMIAGDYWSDVLAELQRVDKQYAAMLKLCRPRVTSGRNLIIEVPGRFQLRKARERVTSLREVLGEPEFEILFRRKATTPA
jgi:hypothetical protein